MSSISVIVCGSRTITDRDVVFSKLDYYLQDYPSENITIIEGDSRGPDRIAADYARTRGMKRRCMPANWQRYGRAAGPLRNEKMLKEAQRLGNPHCIAFWDGKSYGTKDMIQKCMEAGVKTVVINCKAISSQKKR